jgi:protein-disulfide isomerase
VIKERFIDKGQVRFVWRNFPIYGGHSRRMAEAAYCAHEQGSFWGYQLRLQSGRWPYTDAQLHTFAADLGLDGNQFRDCLATGKYAALIEQEFKAAREQGVTGTPTFIVNGKTIVGRYPAESWTQFLNEALAAKGS